MEENTTLSRIIELLRKELPQISDRYQIRSLGVFGSYVHERQDIHSDLDLLVVKKGAHRRKLAQAIYRRLFGVGQAVDIVVVTPEDIERYRDAVGLIIGPAIEQGKVIYAA